MAKLPEQTRMIVLVALLAVAAVVAIVRNLPQGTTVADVLSGDVIEYSPQELPVLIAEETAGNGAEVDSSARNPFTFGAPPTPTRNTTPRPTLPPPPPRTPRPTPTPRLVRGENGELLPPPPPFDRAYLGHLGPGRSKVAVFRVDEKLEVAIEGEVVGDVFILREIGLESVVIGFVGYPEKETTRVPLAEN